MQENQCLQVMNSKKRKNFIHKFVFVDLNKKYDDQLITMDVKEKVSALHIIHHSENEGCEPID